MTRDEHLPGERARCSGRYEELNVFGARTGMVHYAREGEPLPSAPRGFTWQPLTERSTVEIRASATDYRRMANAAATPAAAASLHLLANRFDALAEAREHEENAAASAQAADQSAPPSGN